MRPAQQGGTLAHRVVARYVAAADDMQTILLKLRKGSTIPIKGLKNLKKVLDHLGGWNVEPCVGVTHVKYPGSFVDRSPTNVAELHALAKKHEVKSLPVSPRVDEVYIMDLTEILPAHGGSQQGFKFELWVGAAGFEITAPNGKKFQALPSKSAWEDAVRDGDFRRLPKLGPKPAIKFIFSYDYRSWLKTETDFDNQVLEALGMEAHKPGAQRTKENTGSCGACFRNIKLKVSGGTLTVVNHGFKRPGWGSIQGNCVSVGYPPFELSPEGTKHLVKVLEKQRVHLEETLANLKAGNLETLAVEPGNARSVVERGHPGWDRDVALANERYARMIKWLTDDIEKLEKLIANWKEEPLPTAGTIVKDWQFKKR